MKIALFGGTFDPVHWGHLLLAESARIAFHLDRVVFIPTGIPPHKSAPEASAAQRVKMLRLATASNPQFQVNEWEVRQGRVVYSYETIAHFRGLWPRAKLFFIVGTDMLLSIDSWRTGRAILKQCRFLVADRPGDGWSRVAPAVRRQARQIDWPSVPISSSDIRDRVRAGKSVRYQVADPVEKYIRAHRIYR
jgi:nicotinate-nucleotide adenylyltransferase